MTTTQSELDTVCPMFEGEGIEEEIDDILQSLGLDNTVSKCLKGLDDDMDTLESEFMQMAKKFDEMEDLCENARTLYNSRAEPKHEIVTLPPVDINVHGVMSLAKKSKEGSYLLERGPPIYKTEMFDEERKEYFGEESFFKERLKFARQARFGKFFGDKAVSNKPGSGDDEDEICEITPVGSPIPRTPLAATPTVIPRVMPKVGDKVFVMRTNSLNFWVRGEILEATRQPRLEFKVQYEASRCGKAQNSIYQTKMAGPKHIAYNLPCPFVLPVPTRIIARFKDICNTEPYGNGNYYAGIIAEPPKSQNGYRYLIFFDDGYAQYVEQQEVFLVCESSKEVWLDVHSAAQPFIKKYVKDYPERPMLRLQKGSIVNTEWNGKWFMARVLEVDGSLAKLSFDDDVNNRVEWLYRGSTRFSPLYIKLEKSGSPSKASKFRDNSLIEYDCGNEDSMREAFSRVARKSTVSGVNPHANDILYRSARPPGAPHGFLTMEYEGRVQQNVQVPRSVVPPRKYIRHKCSRACVQFFEEDKKEYLALNPLCVPLWVGFSRDIVRIPKRVVFYRTPCGRRLRDPEDLQSFLTDTDYNMSIDYFSFDVVLDIFNEFVPYRNMYSLADITGGKELVKVPCINSVDHEYPPYVDYTKDRIPSKDVKMNLDPDFLACCDCTDDCLDQEKCACWQMTMKGIRKTAPGDDLKGYEHRRLYNHIFSGIYECNQRCHCKKTCSNRVAQNSMRWQLQVFKTSTKGWAIRPLYDIPRGSFICVYAGQILTEQGANKDGKEHGDEYLAELDYIEVMESIKEGYEHHAVDPSVRLKRRDSDKGSATDASPDLSVNAFNADSEESSGEEDYHAADEDYFAQTVTLNRTISTRLSEPSADEDKNTANRKEEKNKNQFQSEELGRREPSSFGTNFAPDSNECLEEDDEPSTRALFGPDEQCYIMDAKAVGNIGRYLNHSCEPNVFVQNVFVDTHDLRFPWVAFFAHKHIRGGSEMTWDYNYDIGSVPNKTMYCYCGTQRCRGRLL